MRKNRPGSRKDARAKTKKGRPVSDAPELAGNDDYFVFFAFLAFASDLIAA